MKQITKRIVAAALICAMALTPCTAYAAEGEEEAWDSWDDISLSFYAETDEDEGEEPEEPGDPDEPGDPEGSEDPGDPEEPEDPEDPGGDDPVKPAASPVDRMTDIANHWGIKAITYCLEAGWMSGVSLTTFAPGHTVTRAQIVQVLYNFEGNPSTEGMKSLFEDIAGHWAEAPIVWAYNKKIVSGTSVRGFSPDSPVTREQAATMFKTYHEYITGEKIETEEDYLWRYGDRPQVSSWAKEGISWASQYAVMSGVERSTFAPKKACTRAELAQIVQNYRESKKLFPPELEGAPSVGPGTVVGQPNSPLVDYVKLSPHHSGRRICKIDTVTIHCMAGNMSVESCGAWFAHPTAEASSNYGIGSDGRIGLYVDERNRSWCSSSYANDERAVTIEVANIGGGPLWPVSQKAYSALIELLTDICRRNNIKQLLWKADPSLIGQVSKQNMTVHRWFAAKSCPGEYLYSHMGDIAAQVNRKLATLQTRDGLSQGLASANFWKLG